MITKLIAPAVALAALGLAGYSAFTASRLEAELDTMRREASHIDAPQQLILPPELSRERLLDEILPEPRPELRDPGCAPAPGRPGPQLC